MRESIGLQLWSVQDELVRDRRATLARIAATGVDSVELFGRGIPGQFREQRLEGARRWRTDLDDSGLAVSGAHSKLPVAGEVHRVFEELAILGVDAVVCAAPDHLLGFTKDAFATTDSTRRWIDAFNSVAEVAPEFGMQLGYHNHWFEWEGGAGFGADESAYSLLVAELDPDVFLEVDLYWAQVGGADPEHVVETAADRLRFLHVKDGPLERGRDNVALGTGAADLAAAAGTNPRVQRIIEFDQHGDDVWTEIEASVAWLRADAG